MPSCRSICVPDQSSVGDVAASVVAGEDAGDFDAGDVAAGGGVSDVTVRVGVEGSGDGGGAGLAAIPARADVATGASGATDVVFGDATESWPVATGPGVRSSVTTGSDRAQLARTSHSAIER